MRYELIKFCHVIKKLMEIYDFYRKLSRLFRDNDADACYLIDSFDRVFRSLEKWLPLKIND